MSKMSFGDQLCLGKSSFRKYLCTIVPLSYTNISERMVTDCGWFAGTASGNASIGN